MDESTWVERRPELLTLDYNFGGTSHSGIDVPRIVGSEDCRFREPTIVHDL